jgi:hypothetical protein
MFFRAVPFGCGWLDAKKACVVQGTAAIHHDDVADNGPSNGCIADLRMPHQL